MGGEEATHGVRLSSSSPDVRTCAALRFSSHKLRLDQPKKEKKPTFKNNTRLQI